jgi:hypothetical protein
LAEPSMTCRGLGAPVLVVPLVPALHLLAGREARRAVGAFQLAVHLSAVGFRQCPAGPGSPFRTVSSYPAERAVGRGALCCAPRFSEVAGEVVRFPSSHRVRCPWSPPEFVPAPGRDLDGGRTMHSQAVRRCREPTTSPVTRPCAHRELSLICFDGHSRSGVQPREDVHHGEHGGRRSLALAVRSRRSSRPRSSSCAGVVTARPAGSPRTSIWPGPRCGTG